MAGQRPINADVPPPEAPTPRVARRRKPVPAALKAVGGLFALAIVFIVAAILGGGGGGKGSTTDTPAPVVGGGHAEPTPSTPASELGYPQFATANTTRVGGSEPASTAAGVALAAYPSTEPAQRPAAVSLVDAADWRGAIAASVLMAAPVRAPVLVSEAAGLPDATAQALEALDPQGSDATGGTQVFALGGAAAPADRRTKSVKATGIGAAAAIAALRDELVKGPPHHVIVAPADQPAFAMPAAAWAARSGDPVLFSASGKLPTPTAAALKRHPHAPAYVLGPSSAISSNVVREVGEIVDRVRRVSGEDPVANAIALARYSGGGFGWNVNDPGHGFVIANEAEPLDAAAAAALSASGTWGPLLLTDSADTLPSALRGYLLDVKPGYTTDPTRAFYNHVWVIGDEEAIDVNQQAEINQLAELAKIGGEP
ncbi:MAG TPA: cell wall-binding repeat-containing protein [Solirubrobacterales bacterium]|nr:cell wall-binding repeat-containing protein [Solirubrobacterales bacterium]